MVPHVPPLSRRRALLLAAAGATTTWAPWARADDPGA